MKTVDWSDPSNGPPGAEQPSGGAVSPPGDAAGGTGDVEPTLFRWPPPRPDVPEAGPSILRRLDVHRLVAVEQAAAAASEPVARFWRSLAASSERAVSPHALDTLFRDSLRAMSQLLEVDTVAILLANESGDELVARAAIGLSEELTLGLGIRAGEGMAGRVLASRRPLLVGDLSAIHVVNPILRTSGLHSVVAVPLLGLERPLGVMYAASYEVGQFSEADAALLELLADRLAAALQRVRLFEQERAARRDAERLARRIGRMQQVTALLAAVGTTEEAAAALVGALVEEAGGGSPWWSAVWLVDGPRLVPVHHATSGAPLPPPVAMDLADDAPPARAARDCRPRYLTGPGPAPASLGSLLTGVPPQSPAADDPAVIADTPGEPFDGGAFAALPVLSGNGCVAVLGLAYPGWRSFHREDREFLEAVVRQASLAFDRARLRAEQEQLASLAGFFAGAARTLADASDLPDTLDRLADLSFQALGEICLIDLVDENGNGVRMVAKHRDPALQPLVDRLREDFRPDPLGVHPATEVLRTGITRWSDHMSADFLRATTGSPQHFAVTQQLGFRSYVTVAIVSGGEVMGTLTSVSTSRALGRDDVALAEQLTRQVAGLVDNARRFDTASHTSRVLQASLLPRDLAPVPGLAVETRYLPGTRALEVGGDFYDLYPLPGGAVGFAIGDVAGHDRGAAALMGHLRTAARALAGRSSSPAELVAALRASWELLGFDRMATAVFGVLDPGGGHVAMASAGHYPPLLVGADRSVAYLEVPPGPPLGAPTTTEGPPPEWRGTVEPGQVLLLFTDGAVDERGAGSERGMAAIARAAAIPSPRPATVCDEVVRHLPADRADDVALLALSVEAGMEGAR